MGIRELGLGTGDWGLGYAWLLNDAYCQQAPCSNQEHPDPRSPIPDPFGGKNG